MPAPAPRPTLADIQPGTPYSTAFVAAFLGRTQKYVCELVAKGVIAGSRPVGGRYWMVFGQAVLDYLGANNLDRARAAEAAALPSEADERRRAEAALRRMQTRRRGAKK